MEIKLILYKFRQYAHVLSKKDGRDLYFVASCREAPNMPA